MPSGSTIRISTSKVEIKGAEDTVSTFLVGTLCPSQSKVTFFSESVIRFSNLQKKIFQITMLNLKFPPITVNNLFQF